MAGHVDGVVEAEAHPVEVFRAPGQAVPPVGVHHQFFKVGKLFPDERLITGQVVDQRGDEDHECVAVQGGPVGPFHPGGRAVLVEHVGDLPGRPSLRGDVRLVEVIHLFDVLDGNLARQASVVVIARIDAQVPSPVGAHVFHSLEGALLGHRGRGLVDAGLGQGFHVFLRGVQGGAVGFPGGLLILASCPGGEDGSHDRNRHSQDVCVAYLHVNQLFQAEDRAVALAEHVGM